FSYGCRGPWSAFIISSNAKGVFPIFRHLSTTSGAMQEPCSISRKEFSHRFGNGQTGRQDGFPAKEPCGCSPRAGLREAGGTGSAENMGRCRKSGLARSFVEPNHQGNSFDHRGGGAYRSRTDCPMPEVPCPSI